MNNEDFEKLKKTNMTAEEMTEKMPLVQLLIPYTEVSKELLEVDRELGKKTVISSLAAIIIHCTTDIDEAMEIIKEIEKIFINCDKDINKN